MKEGEEESTQHMATVKCGKPCQKPLHQLKETDHSAHYPGEKNTMSRKRRTVWMSRAENKPSPSEGFLLVGLNMQTYDGVLGQVPKIIAVLRALI